MAGVKEYVLPHDAAESQRLNLQHEAFVSSTGYLLHPRIASSLEDTKEVPHIADVATGTGAWLLALEAERPQWQYTGLDISSAQFPPATNGSKCNFITTDIRQPVPSSLRHSFDVVHIRLLLGGLTTPDWVTVARNAFDLLKPGGWIQWHEVDVTSIRAYPTGPGPTNVQGSQRLLKECISGIQRAGKWMKEDMPLFAERVTSAGFGEVEVHQPSSDRVTEMREQSSATMCGAVAAALKYLVESEEGCGISGEKAEGIAKEGMREVESGRCYWRWDGYVVTGRKAA